MNEGTLLKSKEAYEKLRTRVEELERLKAEAGDQLCLRASEYKDARERYLHDLAEELDANHLIDPALEDAKAEESARTLGELDRAVGAYNLVVEELAKARESFAKVEAARLAFQAANLRPPWDEGQTELIQFDFRSVAPEVEAEHSVAIIPPKWDPRVLLVLPVSMILIFAMVAVLNPWRATAPQPGSPEDPPQIDRLYTYRGNLAPGLSRPMPSKPIPGQSRPPCLDPMTTEINGGCWVEVNVPSNTCLASPRAFAHEGKCYIVAVEPEPRPSSDASFLE